MPRETIFVTWRGHGFDVALIDSMRAAFGTDVIECAIPPLDETFAYVVSVLDYWRLSKARCRSNNVPHFSDWIGEEIIVAIKDRGRLIFDLSNEGPVFDPMLFNEIECWIADHQIPQERVAFVQQNRKMGSQYKCYCPEGRLKFFYFDFYLLTIYVSCAREAQMRDDAKPTGFIRSEEGTTETYITGQELENRYPFLCFNYAPRGHRVLLMLALLESGVLGRSLVSFAGLEVPDKQSFDDTHLEPFHNWKVFPALVKILPELRALGPLIVDPVKDGGNALAFNLDRGPYERVQSVLVSETDSTDGSIRRITEKSIKPLFFERPFLIHGNPFSLSLLRELGFQTFHPVIDETYDEIAEPEIRFALLTQEIRRLATLPSREWENVRGQTREICTFNRSFLLSDAAARYYDLHVAPLLAWLSGPIMKNDKPSEL